MSKISKKFTLKQNLNILKMEIKIKFTKLLSKMLEGSIKEDKNGN